MNFFKRKIVFWLSSASCLIFQALKGGHFSFLRKNGELELLSKQKASSVVFSFRRGQATVEYILLLVVVMAIAFGIGGPLGRHLKDFSGSLLGPQGYYACLTKEGVLPKGVYGSSGTNPCGNYSALAGNHLKGVSSGGSFTTGSGRGSGGFGGSSSSGGTDEGDSESGNSKEGDSFRHRINNGSGDSRSSERSGSAGEDLNNSIGNQDSFLAGGGRKKRIKRKRKKRLKISGDGSVGGSFKKKKGGDKRTKSEIPVQYEEAYLGDGTYSDDTEDNQAVFKAFDQGKKAGAEAEAEEEKNTQLIPNRKLSKTSEIEDDNKGLNFSKFLKYLIIAIMIIVILVVIFSQIMEYQSRD